MIVLIRCYRNCDLQNLKAVHMARKTIWGVIWRFGSVFKLLLDICLDIDASENDYLMGSN